jgi:hypothetical protein
MQNVEYWMQNAYDVLWIHENLTVESSPNFRDLSIRYHSRSWTFKVNERNWNNKFLKENVEETIQNIKVFQIIGMNQIEQRSTVLFLRLKGLSKRSSITSLLQCSRRIPSRTRVWWDCARRLFWAWIRKRPHYHPKMMVSMKLTK